MVVEGQGGAGREDAAAAGRAANEWRRASGGEAESGRITGETGTREWASESEREKMGMQACMGTGHGVE